jgi:hypothetical protein
MGMEHIDISARFWTHYFPPRQKTQRRFNYRLNTPDTRPFDMSARSGEVCGIIPYLLPLPASQNVFKGFFRPLFTSHSTVFKEEERSGVSMIDDTSQTRDLLIDPESLWDHPPSSTTVRNSEYFSPKLYRASAILPCSYHALMLRYTTAAYYQPDSQQPTCK